MEPTQELADSLYLDKVRAARSVPPDQKMAMVLELSEAVFARMAEGVRQQFPQFTAEQVWNEVRRRLDISRKLENTPLPAAFLDPEPSP